MITELSVTTRRHCELNARQRSGQREVSLGDDKQRWAIHADDACVLGWVYYVLSIPANTLDEIFHRFTTKKLNSH